MRYGNIVLAVGHVVVVGGLILLFLRVQAPAEVVVSPEDMMRARQQYERSQRGQARAVAPAADRPAAARASSTSPRASTAVKAAARGNADATSTTGKRNDTSDRNNIDDEQPIEIVRYHYDRADFPKVLELGTGFLRDDPAQRYILRATTVAACALGEENIARNHYERMIPEDKRTAQRRCQRFGFSF